MKKIFYKHGSDVAALNEECEEVAAVLERETEERKMQQSGVLPELLSPEETIYLVLGMSGSLNL